MTDESGLMREGVVVLSGPALRTTLQAALIAIKHRSLSGLPTQAYEALACELRAAMAAAGHSVVRSPAISHPVPMPPTVPIAEAAARLDKSHRHARRLAPQLGGQKIGRSWFVDETALREHIEGRVQ